MLWRICPVAALACLAAPMVTSGWAQPAGTDGLREDVEARYEVSPVRGGIALLPKDSEPGGITLIELRGETAHVNGQADALSAQELAAALGSDAALLLRLMYLDAATQRAVLELPPLDESESLDVEPAADPTPSATDGAAEESSARERRVVRRDIVRIGGEVHVEADERIRGNVVVIGGSVVVDGEVQGDIVVVGGSARFGPEAVAERDVTIVGGRLTRAPGARFSRGVTEVGIDMFDFSGFSGFPSIRFPDPSRPWFRSMDLVGTMLRFAFFGLLGSIVLLVAAGSVERVARRAALEPVKAGFVGFLAQMLFVPLLLIGTILLVVTLVGIPLLALMPVLFVAVLAVMVLGFTGVAQRVGQLATRRTGETGRSVLLPFWLGLAVLMTPGLFGEVLGLLDGPFGIFAVTLGVVGFVVEYVAWTTGIGAVILNKFGGGPVPAPAGGASPPPMPVPTTGNQGPLDEPLADSAPVPKDDRS